MNELLSKVDHTLLSITATEAEFETLCAEAIKYNVACVCVPPSRVTYCTDLLAGKIAVCTVVGFPTGYSAVKAFEAETAIRHGATEIDMVIDIGRAKEGSFDYVLEDISDVRKATWGHCLKVIIETAVLTEDEIIRLCGIVSESGADFIKTSTGFSTGGATCEDIIMLRKHSAAHVKVKAAGGITTLETAQEFIRLGADRLGTSRIVKLVQGLEGSGY